MTFLLIRYDSPEPAKHSLKDRVVKIIGRGAFPDCNDKRISRDHASVTIKGEKLILKSLHQNPCFYKRRLSDKRVMLTEGETVELIHGDRFGLLPDSTWYELIYFEHNDPEDDKNNAEAQNNDIQNDPNKTENDDQTTPTKRPHDPDQDISIKKMKTEAVSPINKDTVDGYEIDSEVTEINSKETKNCNEESTDPLVWDEANLDPREPMDVTEDDNDATKSDISDNNDPTDAESQHTLNDINEAGDKNNPNEADGRDQGQHTPNEITEDEGDQSKDTSDSLALNYPPDSDTDDQCAGDKVAVKKEPESPVSSSTAPLESAHNNNPADTTESSGQKDPTGSDTDGPSSGNEMDVKKETEVDKDVKKEPKSPEDDKDVKNPAVATAGSSHDQAGQPGSSSDDGAPPKPPNLPPRERCLYGAQCYRKNPQHKIQFSHPGDADYGAGERGRCPYGATCRRRDPRHWAAHDHPPHAAPPPRHAPGLRVVQRRGQIFYINAHDVHFHEDNYEVEDEDGDSVDYDYEF